MKTLKNNNNGFSLVELIVVIAVMAVALGFVSITGVVVHNAKVGGAVNNMKSSLATARTQSMAKGTLNGEMIVSVEDGVVYAKVGNGEKQRICTKMIECYVDNCDTLPTALGGTKVSNGEVAHIKFNTAGMPTEYDNNTFFFKRGKRTMVVMVYPVTGKITSKLL